MIISSPTKEISLQNGFQFMPESWAWMSLPLRNASPARSGAGIREDMRAAQILGITGTPAYLIGRRLADSEKVEILEVVKGLPPYEYLEDKLNGFLASGSPTKQ